MKIHLFVLSLLVIYSHGMHLSGHRLFDLEFQGEDFIQEAELWETDATMAVKTSLCNGNMILGGSSSWTGKNFNKDWIRTYKNLPPHTKISFQATPYLIDDWSGFSSAEFRLLYNAYGSGYANIPIDYIMQAQKAEKKENLCGRDVEDIPPFLVFKTFAHARDEIILRISVEAANIDSGVASWGIRDIVLSFDSDSPGTSCAVAPFNLFQNGERACSCKSPLTLKTGAGYCDNCHESCSYCNKEGSSGCIACPKNKYLTEEGQCLECNKNCESCSGTSDYCTTCKSNSHLVQSEDQITSTCYDCEVGKYLIADGQCAYCASTCATCLGNEDDCTSCADGEYLTDNKCNKCSSDCKTCSISPNSCTSCAPDKYLTAESKCAKECSEDCETCSDLGDYCMSCAPEKYLTNEGKCIGCDESCRTCKGVTPNSCTSCPYNKYLTPEGKCIDECAEACETCSETIDYCTSCKDEKQYSTREGHCVNCDLSCNTCSGDSANDCISCAPDKYLTADGKCADECVENCKTCLGNADHCTSCADDEYLADNKCNKCSIDCKTCSTSPNSCTSCALDKYLTADGKCSDKCTDDCKTCSKTAYHCTSCNDETKYPTAEGKCTKCHSSCYTCSGETANFCTSCKLDNYLIDSTCYDECLDPLKKVQIDNIWHCQSICKSTEYAHWDGKTTSCLEECNHPLIKKKIASYLICTLCGEDEYFDDSAGICKSTNLPGQFSLVVDIDDKSTKVTFIDQTISAENVNFALFGKDYTLSSAWSFFGLNSMGEYNLENWNVNAKCGCFKQVCGQDCAKGVECHDNSATASSPWLCSPWAEKTNYCWSLVSSGQQTYTAYNLTHISTIALTSYGGPDSAYVSPGFTITDSLSSTQNYALNAMIMNLTPRRDIDLAASYRYAESKGQVITSQHFANLNARPKINANLSAAFCNDATINLPLSLTYQNEEKAPTFHTYTILRKGALAKLTTLLNLDILTPHGVLEWNNQARFDIVDPCNQQFLTLQRDPVGNFFVELPISQRLTDDTICIAINDVSTSQYDLVLYELKNKSPTWFVSDRFVGLISKDYVQDLTLRIATKADRTISLPTIQMKVEFSSSDANPPFIQVTTSSATTCQVYLSPRCSFPISTSQGSLFARYSYSNCGYLYEKAGYNCQGVTGYFYPPPILVRTPISKYFENTTFISAHNQNFYAIGSSYDDQDFLTGFKSLWTHWTWENAPNKIFNIMVGIVFLIICFKTRDIFHQYKNKRNHYNNIDQNDSA